MTLESTERTRVSVQPEWCLDLPLQQQSVLLLAARGPDGVRKDHPCKAVVRAYRGTVLVAARYGRPLEWGETGDTFMCLKTIASQSAWADARRRYLEAVDELPHHYHLHLVHGAEILGYKHPEACFRAAWFGFYLHAVEDMHLVRETESELDARLSDWRREEWGAPVPTVTHLVSNQALTLCCRKTLTELPRSHRATIDRSLATCEGLRP